MKARCKIKKSSSSTWINADYNIPLEKGDVVQTGSEGMAKVVFNDGTNYTVKQDSLIVIEENSANDQQQTERYGRGEHWNGRPFHRCLQPGFQVAGHRRGSERVSRAGERCHGP